MSIRHSPVPLAGAGAIVASLALAACGGSPSGPAGAPEDEQQLVKFARCMRAHGLNISTPNGASQGIRITGAAKNPHQLEAAQEACKRYQPKGRRPNLSPQERVAREEAVQKFAKCMREHGQDVHASTSGGGGIVKIQQSRGQAGSGPSPDSPAFQAAQKACQGLMPGPKVLGGKGPRTSSSSSSKGPGDSGASLSIQAGG